MRLSATQRTISPAKCESNNPFGEGAAGATVAPLELAYKTDKSFDVDGSFQRTVYKHPQFTIDDETIRATFDVDNVPSSLAALVALPTGPTDTTPTRVLTHAPGAANIAGDLTLESTLGNARCTQAEPSGGKALCADVVIDSLPDHVSVLADTAIDKNTHIAFHACDFDFFAGTDTCRAGTETPTGIGSVNAHVRQYSGDADPLPILPMDDIANEHHAALALERGVGDQDMAIEGDVFVENIRHIDVRQFPSGMTAHTDLGDGDQPFTVRWSTPTSATAPAPCRASRSTPRSTRCPRS